MFDDVCDVRDRLRADLLGGDVLDVLEPDVRVQSPPCGFWWLRLHIERIKPAHPEQNGRHERMDLTMKKEATRPAAKSLHKQQERFNRFLHVYSQERPHQAIEMKYPAELYVSSSRGICV